MAKTKLFNTKTASLNLIAAMEVAIKNMTDEVQKPIDQELSGSARKAELSAIKETALACKELILERQKLLQIVDEFEEKGELKEKGDFSSSFAELYSK